MGTYIFINEFVSSDHYGVLELRKRIRQIVLTRDKPVE